jgi:hypothetical protein
MIHFGTCIIKELEKKLVSKHHTLQPPHTSNDTNMIVRTNLSEAYRVTVVVIFKSILTGSKAFGEIVN